MGAKHRQFQRDLYDMGHARVLDFKSGSSENNHDGQRGIGNTINEHLLVEKARSDEQQGQGCLSLGLSVFPVRRCI